MARTTPALDPSQLVSLLERIPDVVWRYRLVPAAAFEYVSPSVFALTGYTPAPCSRRRSALPSPAAR